MHGMDRYNLKHTYDALNRLTSTTGDQGYKTHIYTYDSLGNLIKEQVQNKVTDYQYNKLNQQVQKIVDEKDTYGYTFDKRGNLIEGVYFKNKNQSYTVEKYVYDATNRMVKGVNEAGEESHYIFNGLGHLIGNEWIIKINAYGYTGLDVKPSDQVNGVVVCDRHENNAGNGHINPTGNGHTTGGVVGGTAPSINSKLYMAVHKDYVLDYTSPLINVLMETESDAGGLTYRYVYGLKKNSATIYGIPNGSGDIMQKVTYPSGSADVVKLYYHHDRLGSTHYLTDNVAGKVTSFVSYDDWGALTSKAVLRMGVRELDLVQEYTGHPADMALGLYYAKARMYAPINNRWLSRDPIKGDITKPITLLPYAYCNVNPIKYIDPLGLLYAAETGGAGSFYSLSNEDQLLFISWATASQYVPFKNNMDEWYISDTIGYGFESLFFGYNNPYDVEMMRSYYLRYIYNPKSTDDLDLVNLENAYINWLEFDAGFQTPEQAKQHEYWDTQFAKDLEFVATTAAVAYFSYIGCTAILSIAGEFLSVTIGGPAAAWFANYINKINTPTLALAGGGTIQDVAIKITDKMDIARALELLGIVAKMIDPNSTSSYLSASFNNFSKMIGGNSTGGNIQNQNDIPNNARTTKNVDEIYKRLEKYHGIDPKEASERLHYIKRIARLGPADNVIFDLTGNVYKQTGEWIGTLTKPIF